MKKSQQLEGDDILTTPLGFVEQVLGLPLYDWQAMALMPLEKATGPNKEMVQIAVVSPNGGGRSSRVVCGAALWWAAMHPKGRVVITTRDGKQLQEQIIPGLEDQIQKFSGWERNWSPYYKITTPTGGSIIAYTTNDEGRVEGAHSNPESPLLIIVDEAKSVGEKIFEAVDKCTYDALMYTSSPGLMIGTFYNAFTKNRKQFHTVQASLEECAHIPKAKIDRVIAKYGKDHPFTKATIWGKFIAQDDTTQFAVPLDALQHCLQNPPRHRPGMKVIFCDFGGATSEHVVAYRDGNKIEILAAWREANKEAAANRFVREFKKSGLQEHQIFCDASDLEIFKLISDAGWTINRQNFGAPANNPDEFISWGAEAWIEGGMDIGRCELILPADDEEFISQATTRKKTIGHKGKQGVQEKHDMVTKDNLPSCDRADAVLGANASYDMNYALNQKQPFRIPSGAITERGLDDFSMDHSEVLEGIGANAGL